MSYLLNELCLELDKNRGIFESDLDWQTKYIRIFANHSSYIIPLLSLTGHKLEWSDPDADYEDDVRAYMAAAAQLRERVRHELDVTTRIA
jgi:hypothetical protein